MSTPRRHAADLAKRADEQMRQFFGEPTLPRGLDAFFPEAPPTPTEARPPVAGKPQTPAHPSEPFLAPHVAPLELREDLPEAILGEAFRAVMDFVLPPLPLSEQVTYLWLFRYAYGFGRNHCRVSRPALMRVTGLSKRGVDLALSHLEARGWIQTVEVSYRQGTHYRVYLPHERVGLPSEPSSWRLSSQPESRELPSKLPTPLERENIDIKLLSQESSQLSSSSLLSSQQNDPRLEQLLDKFYAGLGQRRISSVKRERGLEILMNLLQDGYSIEEIAYAIDWAVASIPKLHSIRILPEIMGQALAARERFLTQTGQVRKTEEALTRTREEATRLKALRETLSPKVLTEIQTEAEAQLKAKYPEPPPFGWEILRQAAVDDLLKERYLNQNVGTRKLDQDS